MSSPIFVRRFRYSKKAVAAVAENPTAIVHAGPVAVAVIAVEWIYEIVKKT
jgi:hypothetical protein